MSFYQTSYIFLQAAEKICPNPYPANDFCPKIVVSFLGLLHLRLLLIKEACTHYVPYSECYLESSQIRKLSVLDIAAKVNLKYCCCFFILSSQSAIFQICWDWSVLAGDNASCPRTQHSASSKDRTCNPLILNQALYH